MGTAIHQTLNYVWYATLLGIPDGTLGPGTDRDETYSIPIEGECSDFSHQVGGLPLASEGHLMRVIILDLCIVADVTLT